MDFHGGHYFIASNNTDGGSDSSWFTFTYIALTWENGTTLPFIGQKMIFSRNDHDDHIYINGTTVDVNQGNREIYLDIYVYQLG